MAERQEMEVEGVTRRGKVFVAVYVLVASWAIYRTVMGYPALPGGLLERLAG
jgi:hypothetical protein